MAVRSYKPLTTASGPFLANPPADFHNGPLMHRRGALHIGTGSQRRLAAGMLADFARSGVEIEIADREMVERIVPGVRTDWTHGLWEPACADIDVATLHSAYLRKAKRLGVKLLCNARLETANWQAGSGTCKREAGI